MTTLGQLADQTERLLRTARKLEDVSAPSLCAGWTRGHVLTHIARNADGLARAAKGAVDGSGATMYDSVESRDEDIEAGAFRPLADLVDDVAITARLVADALAAFVDAGPEVAEVVVPRTPGGPTFHARAIPDLRLREVVYHHVDLDAGFGFADLDSDLVSTLLADQVRRLSYVDAPPSMRVRTDEGDVFTIGDGAAYVTGSRAGVLLWLARQDPSGVQADELPTLPTGI